MPELIVAALLAAACWVALHYYGASRTAATQRDQAQAQAAACQRSVVEAKERADRAYEEALTRFVAPAAQGRQDAEHSAWLELVQPATRPDDDAASARDRILRYTGQ